MPMMLISSLNMTNFVSFFTLMLTYVDSKYYLIVSVPNPKPLQRDCDGKNLELVACFGNVVIQCVLGECALEFNFMLDVINKSYGTTCVQNT